MPPDIVIVANCRSERGPLQSVIAALPEAEEVCFPAELQVGHPSRVMSLALDYFHGAFARLNPRVVVVLGDRYETLAAALAATFLRETLVSIQRIKLVHIHGGETTTGAFDDALRHSITHLTEQSGGAHCVATYDAQERVYEMLGGKVGPDRLRIVGAPGLDGVEGSSATRTDKLILVTYHPETRAADYGLAGCKAMLGALPLGYETRFCGVNNDPGNADIRAAINNQLLNHGGVWCPDMPHAMYVGLMQRASLVIGNSSAGIIEAPWVGVPSVNIGMRQHGRPHAHSVTTAPVGNVESIRLAITTALSWRGPWAPCYRGGAAPRIAEIVRGMV